MGALIPLVALDQPGDHVLAWLRRQLTTDGYRVVLTFDLQVARSANTGCTCPHHGSAECDCQMAVLLVYGKVGDPASVVLHSQDGQTWLSLVDAAPERGNQHIEAAIRRILIPHLPNLPSIIEVASEDRSTE